MHSQVNVQNLVGDFSVYCRDSVHREYQGYPNSTAGSYTYSYTIILCRPTIGDLSEGVMAIGDAADGQIANQEDAFGHSFSNGKLWRCANILIYIID